MKKVAIINGIARMTKYNAHLASLYHQIGITESKEYQFPFAKLFSCHRHSSLEEKVMEIVEYADVVHCQSSSFFPVLPYMHKHNIKKPLILESPVLKSHTGTLLAATNRAKHYSHPKQSKAINFLLDTLAFTPEWTADTLSTLQKSKDSGAALVLHSSEDSVSDIEGLEQYFNVIYGDGNGAKHARLYGPKSNNDFGDVVRFIQGYHESR